MKAKGVLVVGGGRGEIAGGARSGGGGWSGW